jgi:Ca2+/Na+ antiporter
MIVKHIVAWILLVFLVILVNPENADRNIVRTLIISFLVYVWFLMTTRTPFYIMIIIIVLLLIAYILSITRQRKEKEGDHDGAAKVMSVQYNLTITAIILTVVGFVIYYIEKKKEYRSNFSLQNFILGNVKCREYTPIRAQL